MKRSPQNSTRYLERHCSTIWNNLRQNNLWKRIVKTVTATLIVVIIFLIPATESFYGQAAYVGVIITGFGHCGRRLGQEVETLTLGVSGAALGVGWSALGVCLGSLVFETNAAAAYTIRGIFFAFAILFHGFLRSHTPRLFPFLILFAIVAIINLVSPSAQVTSATATQILYPILTAVGVLLAVNLCVFPEFSSSFLGGTTVQTLSEINLTVKDATTYFANVSSKDNPQRSDNLMSFHTSQAEQEHKDDPESSRRPLGVRYISHKWHKTKYEHKSKSKDVTIQTLTAAKAKLRAKVGMCNAAQRECNFELAFSWLPPRDLKPISSSLMNKVVANTVALISACETKFSLTGEDVEHTQKAGSAAPKVLRSSNSDVGEQDLETAQADSEPYNEDIDFAQSDVGTASEKYKLGKSKKQVQLAKSKEQLELVKPRREIEFGDAELLQHVLRRVHAPMSNLQAAIDHAMESICLSVGFTYGLRTLPSGLRIQKPMTAEELDNGVEELAQALFEFDFDSDAALDNVASLHEHESTNIEMVPREEVFLISSFLLNLRQAAAHTLEMMRHALTLVQKRHERKGRRRLYAPSIYWSRWLRSGGEELEGAPKGGIDLTKDSGEDEDDDESQTESSASQHPKYRERTFDPERNTTASRTLDPPTGSESDRTRLDNHGSKKRSESISCLREKLADAVEWTQTSEDLQYALKLTVAAFLVTWPAFVPKWNSWYSLNRGLWAALQLIFITEVSIGSSVDTFILRGVGTVLGCLWGWAADEARNGNRVVCAAMIFLGLIPSFYVALGTKYVKAGIVSMISMCIVALATELETVPGMATENFLQRLIAFMIGAVVALILEVAFLPVKARTKLVEALAAAIDQITVMEACVIYDVDVEVLTANLASKIRERFEKASRKAKGALTAAETLLPFCSQEPRLKGSFAGLALVYNEVIFVLRQICDRMDNLVQLRSAYGSLVLESYHDEVCPDRRNTAAAITLTLFAVHEALTTKLPLPQFLPSARLAHLRTVDKMRELLNKDNVGQQHADRPGETENAGHRARRRKFVAWSAGGAATAEIVEYLEELIDLTKLLVGAMEFRTGLLTRPTYLEYISRVMNGRTAHLDGETSTHVDEHRLDEVEKRLTLQKSRSSAESKELPDSLRRIQTRLQEERLKRRQGFANAS